MVKGARLTKEADARPLQPWNGALSERCDCLIPAPRANLGVTPQSPGTAISDARPASDHNFCGFFTALHNLHGIAGKR